MVGFRRATNLNFARETESVPCRGFPYARFGSKERWNRVPVSAKLGTMKNLGLLSRSGLLAAGLFLVAPAGAQDEEGGSSLGDLFKKVKDIKVPESVTGLPEQLTELKNSYLETAKTVEELRAEVELLREEVYELKKRNEVLTEAVGAKVEADKLDALLQPEEVSATKLVENFVDDPATAAERYGQQYLKVVGMIDRFETGSQSLILYLRADNQESAVRCQVPTGPDLYVEALPAQGRIVSRNDRRSLLSVGQPVAVIGTCQGRSLNVEMINCRIDGLVEKKKEEPPKK